MAIISPKERERKQTEIVSVLEKRKRKEITQREAAKILQCSVRQIQRLEKKYAKNGLASLVHGNSGRPSSRAFNPQRKKIVMELMETKYRGVGPTHAAELLYEDEGIEITPQTLRRFMKEAGLQYKTRKHRDHRYWRKPKDNEGEMLQLDGSDHDWFQGRASRCTLIKFIDDATGKIWARFFPSESYDSVASATLEYIKRFGRPLSIYADRGKVFKVNKSNKDKEFITQYERALKELNIRLIPAYSPQAKGRIERSFGTDQDRLVNHMGVKKISTIIDGNRYLEEYYIPKHNRKFVRKPANQENMHRPIEGFNLNDIFTRNKTRLVKNDWTVQCDNQIYQLHKKQPVIVRPKEEVTICKRLDGSVYLQMRGALLSFTVITEHTIKEAKPELPKIVENYAHKSGKNSPWRKTNSLLFKEKRRKKTD